MQEYISQKFENYTSSRNNRTLPNRIMECVIYRAPTSHLISNNSIQVNMEKLEAEETSLIAYKEQLLAQIEDIQGEIEDLICDYESATPAAIAPLRALQLNQRSAYMQTICDLARLQVQKEIIRVLSLKGMTEEAALKVAKESADQ